MKSKKSQGMQIEFLVKFILAVVVFSLGIVLLWTIYSQAKVMALLPQGEIENKLFALNCGAKEDICVGANVLHMKAGDSTLVDVKLFNFIDTNLHPSATIQLLDGNTNQEIFTDTIEILSKEYSDINLPAKGDGLFTFDLIIHKTAVKGTYVIRILVDRKQPGLDPKVKRINLYVE